MKIFQNIRYTVAALALALTAGTASVASATQYPDFVLDFTQSSVKVTSDTCNANCGVKGGFTASNATVHFGSQGEVKKLSDIISWTIKNTSTLTEQTYKVAVNLMFTAPDAQGTKATGTGKFWTLFGIISSGKIMWDTLSEVVTFDQGSKIGIWMDHENAFAFGSKLTSDIYLGAEKLVPLSAPSPAPIPAALPVMLLALGGMVAIGRRRKAAAAIA